MMMTKTADNIAYMLRTYALALRDIAPFGRNVVYAEIVIRNRGLNRTNGHGSKKNRNAEGINRQ